MKSAAERARAYRARKREKQTPKTKVPKSRAQISREYRARKKASQAGVIQPIVNNCETLKNPSRFKANDDWSIGYERHHGIGVLDTQGQSLSSDCEGAQQFSDHCDLKEQVSRYDPSNIYVADESGLLWKSLPSRTLASRYEESVPGRKIMKEKVTIMLCTNVTGTHKIPLLVIGNDQPSQCFLNKNTLPVVYKNQKDSWMDRDLFEEWYTQIFVPEVKKEQRKTGRHGVVLLLLDDAPCHKLSATRVAQTQNFVVDFFPPNTALILQPMNRGLMAEFKNIYRKSLLAELLSGQNEEIVMQTLGNLTIKDCCCMLTNAWDAVIEKSIQSSWWQVNFGSPEAANSAKQLMDVAEALQLLYKIHGCEQCNEEDTGRWLICDENDNGWQILKDEEPSDQVEYQAERDYIEPTIKEELNEGEAVNQIPTAEEVLSSIAVISQWFEAQNHCDPTYLHQIQKMRASIGDTLSSSEISVANSTDEIKTEDMTFEVPDSEF